MIEVPEELRTAMVYWHGPAGATWIERLPAVVEGLERKFGVRCERVLEGGAVSLVADVRCDDGSPAVLKVAYRDSENNTEPDALRLLGGRRVVRLLAYDRESHGMLLERLEPGTPLLAVVPDEEAANEVAAELLPDIWVTPPRRPRFPSLDRIASHVADRLPMRVAIAPDPRARALLGRARSDLRELAKSQPRRVLLHRDYHRLNVLQHGDGWRIIDPKPVVGDPAFDLGCLIRDDPDAVLAEAYPARRLARRVDQLCEALAVDRERALGWAVGYGLELALDDWPEMLEVVDLLAGLS
jgi:streptomycin 6-kinase